MFQNNFIHALESFNAKERFFVMRQVYGHRSESETYDGFTPSQAFLESLGNALSIKLPIRSRFAAMDYHLNWLYASLCLCQRVKSDQLDIAAFSGHDKPMDESRDGIVLQNQEDIDFLIAFDLPGESRLHVALIEAKATTPWKFDQLESKIGRFRQLSESDASQHVWKQITWHFVLMAPNKLNQSLDASFKGKGNESTGWPKLLTEITNLFGPGPTFMHLLVGYHKDIYSVGLSNGKTKAMTNGTHWAIMRRRKANLLD